MFKFLKEKLKGALSKFSKKVDEEAKEETIEVPVEEEKPKEQVKVESEKVEELKEEPEAELKEEPEAKLEEEPEEPEAEPEEPEEAEPEEPESEEEPKEKAVEKPKKSFLSKFKEKITDTITTKSLSKSKFDDLFWDLEVVLLENNVAVKVIDKIRNNLEKELVEKRVKRNEITKIVQDTLKRTVKEVLGIEPIDLVNKIKNKSPYIILFLGVNGTGKTTNLAKVANYLQKQGFNPVIAACDTFRAAAIQQLEEHANKLDVKMIKHDYGSDPAAVAYDAIEHAKAKDKDVVLIDTAGRMHSNSNLMQELKKIVKVAKPDLKIFVGESITGNDSVEQAITFNENIGVDAIILTKVDIDEKGGAALSISYVLNKPIIFLGTGQTYDDLIKFNPDVFIENLGL